MGGLVNLLLSGSVLDGEAEDYAAAVNMSLAMSVYADA